MGVSDLGSSPLARGTPSPKCSTFWKSGLIPARAGNTYEGWTFWQLLRAHPRSRGEHLRDFTAQPLDKGSSPLARGTPLEPGWGELFLGLIPARAGNTKPHYQRHRYYRAHPRSRGEHQYPPIPEANGQGSSPLARGTPL